MSQILRDYQSQYKAVTHSGFQNGLTSIMNVLPTGTGKTTIFSSLTEDWSLRGNEKTLLIAHRIELVDQMVARLKAFGITAGVIGGRDQLDLSLNVQVAMVQSLQKEIDWKPNYIIVDECHHSTASSWQKLWTYYPTAKNVGFTATPIRLDKKGFKDDYQVMNNLYDPSWYFEKRYLAEVKHLICSNVTENIQVNNNNEYDPVQIAKYMKKAKIIADVINAYTKYSPNKRAVVFCQDIEHSKRVAERFNEQKIPAAHIDGEMDKKERKRIINDFEAGRLMVLTNYDIVSEGFDVPAIETVILARRTKSLSFFIQAVGRCLRPQPGKKYGYVLDCASLWLDHGPAGANYKWSLEGDPIEAYQPLNDTKLFSARTKSGVESILEVNESNGIELLAFEQSLQRLLMFDKFVYDCIEQKEEVETAVEMYYDWLEIQGMCPKSVDINYCKRKVLEITGRSLPDEVLNHRAA